MIPGAAPAQAPTCPPGSTQQGDYCVNHHGKVLPTVVYKVRPGQDKKAPRTFNRDALPVYCAHCSVNNEIQPLEWGGAVTSVEHPPTKPGERCVHHIYKDPAAMPAEAYRDANYEWDYGSD